MPDRVIVLANGEIEDSDTLRARLAGWRGAAVIAADGGLRHAAALGLEVQAVIGDLDSLGADQRSALEAAGVHIEQVSARKDEIDLELALLQAADQGAQQIAVLGGMGGRLDMTLANVLLLAHPRLAPLRVELWAGAQTAWLIRPPGGVVSGQPGDTLSLIPLGGAAQGVRSRGLEYPLDDEELAFGPARGLSNLLSAADASVALREGLLLAIHTPGRA